MGKGKNIKRATNNSEFSDRKRKDLSLVKRVYSLPNLHRFKPEYRKHSCRVSCGSYTFPSKRQFAFCERQRS